MSDVESVAAEAVVSVQHNDLGRAQRWFEIVCSAHESSEHDWEGFQQELRMQARSESFGEASEIFLDRLHQITSDPAAVLTYLYEHRAQLTEWYMSLQSAGQAQDPGEQDLLAWVDPDQERRLADWSPTWRADLVAYLDEGWGADWPTTYRDEDKHAWLGGWLSGSSGAAQEKAESDRPEQTDDDAAAAALTALVDELGTAIPDLAAQLGVAPEDVLAVLDRMDVGKIAEAAMTAVSVN